MIIYKMDTKEIQLAISRYMLHKGFEVISGDFKGGIFSPLTADLKVEKFKLKE